MQKNIFIGIQRQWGRKISLWHKYLWRQSPQVSTIDRCAWWINPATECLARHSHQIGYVLVQPPTWSTSWNRIMHACSAHLHTRVADFKANFMPRTQYINTMCDVRPTWPYPTWNSAFHFFFFFSFFEKCHDYGTTAILILFAATSKAFQSTSKQMKKKKKCMELCARRDKNEVQRSVT